jgi:glycosyltransferase involved in cell wall biosynthesis
LARRAGEWLWGATAVLAATARIKPDVVHFQAALNRRFDAILISAVRRLAPVVWTVHDVIPFGFAARDRPRFARLYCSADVVLCHSEPAAAEIRSLSGVSPRVVPHVPLWTRTGVERDEARRRLGLPADERVLAALGFVRAYKGYDLLADVWTRLGARAPLLLVVGESRDASGESALTRLEATGRADVRRGYADDADLEAAAAAADALLLPHMQASESGLVHLACAVGTPVIASDAPQLAAAVVSSGAGTIVPRDEDAWAAAVTGPLPAAPAPPRPPDECAARHVEAYLAASDLRRRGSA